MRRTTALDLAHAFAAAGTVDEVHDAIEQDLPEVLEARTASLWMVDVDAEVVRLRPSSSGTIALLPAHREIPIGSHNPIAEVVRSRSVLALPDRESWQAHASPELVDEIDRLGLLGTVLVPLFGGTDSVVAVLTVSWDRVIQVGEAGFATIRRVAELCQNSLERAWQTDVASERAMQLADLAARLADALSLDEVLDVVTSFGAAPVGAVATSLGLIDAEEAVLRTHHGRTVDDETRREHTDPPLTAPLAFTEAARTGEPVYIDDYDTYLKQYPDAGASTSGLGYGARAAVPIRSSDGTTIGSIVHAWPGPRHFEPELVSTIATIAEMAGQAIERAQLLERIRRDATHHETMAALAELLATARSAEDVAEVITHHAAAVAAAGTANLAIIDPTGDTMRIYHHPSVDPGIQDEYPAIPRDAPIPHADVVRDGGMLVFEDIHAFGRRYPHLVEVLQRAGRQAAVVAALQDSTGHPLGALGLTWAEPIRLDDEGRQAIRGVARLCAQALERAQLSDAEHRLVNALQESVLVPLPAQAGLDIAGCYLPAARHIGMGGDWYEGIVLDEHRYALVVGDVAGHGITAVGGMAQLQAVIGALVRLGMPLAEIFQQTTRLIRRDRRSVTATALLVVVDTEQQTLSYVAAGHPPPVVRLPDGSTTVLEEGREPLLGVRLESVTEVGSHPFPPGSFLVTYTDGLVERRRELIDTCIDRLVAHLRATPTQDADGVASSLMDAMIGGREPDDDVALVVVRHAPAAG